MSDHEWCRDVSAEITIAEFCDLHRACREGREWALANCATMRGVWGTAKPNWLRWVATRRGVLDDRTLRLFAVWSVRQVQHLTADPRSLSALDVSERHARDEATDKELAAARAAAWAAAWDAARDAARAAASDAARDAARAAARAAAWDAARAAASDAAWAAAWAAVWGAARDAASDAARDAAEAAQAAWLREHAIPNFARQEVIA